MPNRPESALAPPPSKPLDGLLVVAIEQAVAAPVCTGRLAEMGARVIKIERPDGDFARGYDQAANGEASYFVWANRGKESMVLDFKQPEGAALLHRMLAKADVLVQNLAPGALARAGFGAAELRARYPHLILCDISGYGSEGPGSELKAYDLLVQCESGLVGVSGAPEAYGRIGVSICDIGAGLNATIGVLSALAQRARTGKGANIAISLFDSTADWMTVPYVHQVYGQGAPARQGLQHPSIAPYGSYATRDGHDIVISIQNEREWQQFCTHFLRDPSVAADERFSSNNQRVHHRDALNTMIAAAFAQLDRDQALARLGASNTAYGQVRSVAGLARHPALRTWPMSVHGKDLQLIAPPVRAPWDTQRFQPAPRLGQHTESLRAEFSAPHNETTP
ncbi:CaiB/BaiF CoA transferase family protein [Castellaniella sp.]|uniref:CaiB/BaiF CoA transferase family protein n=1 Tax=Castellaniella sp. TaxID=1955812 RepID=UPI0035696890